jgi:hypothetical protein
MTIAATPVHQMTDAGMKGELRGVIEAERVETLRCGPTA